MQFKFGAAAVLLASPTDTAAQGVELGIKAGVTYADTRGAFSEEWNGRLSSAVGALLGVRLSQWLTLRTELLLTEKEVFKSDTLPGVGGGVEIRHERDP